LRSAPRRAAPRHSAVCGVGSGVRRRPPGADTCPEPRAGARRAPGRPPRRQGVAECYHQGHGDSPVRRRQSIHVVPEDGPSAEYGNPECDRFLVLAFRRVGSWRQRGAANAGCIVSPWPATPLSACPPPPTLLETDDIGVGALERGEDASLALTPVSTESPPHVPRHNPYRALLPGPGQRPVCRIVSCSRSRSYDRSRSAPRAPSNHELERTQQRGHVGAAPVAAVEVPIAGLCGAKASARELSVLGARRRPSRRPAVEGTGERHLGARDPQRKLTGPVRRSRSSATSARVSRTDGSATISPSVVLSSTAPWRSVPPRRDSG
jgi:hypothetical protein